MILRLICGLSLFLAGGAFCQMNGADEENEVVTASAEAERKIMEQTFAEVIAIAGKDSARGKQFSKAQNEWVKYVKEQSEADADGVSGEARYPTSYFQTMRELTRYRTRILEGCLSRLKAEKLGQRGDVAANNSGKETGSTSSSARDWKAAVGDEAMSSETTLYTAEIEGVEGIVSGQWKGEDLWRGTFIADRGDGIVLYGGKMERGGIVFEAWQESTRIGRGFIRDEDGTLRGRFFDERRRETPMVLKEQATPKPVGYKVGLTTYSGLVGTKEEKIRLEWHDTHFVRGNREGGVALRGDNFGSGKLYLEEVTGDAESAEVVAVWSMSKSSSGGSTRWLGQRKGVDGTLQAVEFSR